MNEKDNFSLSKNSKIYWSSKKRNLKYKGDEPEKSDFVFYSVAKELSQYMESSIDDKTVKTLFFKYKSLFENNSISPSNSIISLKDIFHYEQIPLINLIWNLVFTLPKNDIINLSKIIHPIESKLLLSSEMMFNNLKRDFEINTPILFKILLTGFTSDQELNNTINALEKEINYLKSAPKSMQEFWDSKDLIIILYGEKKKYDNYLKEMKVHEQINNLKTHLQNSEVPQQFCDLKQELIQNLDCIVEFTEEVYNHAYESVNRFLTFAKHENKND